MNIIGIKKKYEKSIISEDMRASGLIPVLAYSEEHQIFMMDDKSIGFGFHCNPLVGGDSKTQERTIGLLNQELPPGTTLQFMLFRSPDIEYSINNMMTLREGNNDSLLSSVIQERAKFLRSYTEKNLVGRNDKGSFDNGVIQDTKLVVTGKIPISEIRPTNSEIDRADAVRGKVESALQTVGLHPQSMTAQSYIRLMETIINWGEEASWKSASPSWDTNKPICEQIVDYHTDITVSKNSLKLGKQHVSVLSAKKLPEAFYFGNAMSYIGDISGGNSSIKENYMVVTNVFFPDSEKTKSALDKKRQFAVNQAYGPLLKFVPILADKKNGFDVLYDSLKEGQNPIKISYSLMIFAPTKERVDSAAMAARNIWRESRFDLMEDRFIMLPLFFNNLPLCTDAEAISDLFRYKTMTSEQAAVLLPIFSEWKGTGTYHMSLLSRNGQIMSLSLHDSDTNKNFVVAAESGSGKSFLVNEMITSYLSEGAQVWVIDAGKSYKDLCEFFDGDFLQFDDESEISINPFELIVNYADEEDTIVSLIGTMASQRGELSEWQISELKRVMSELWDKKGNAVKVDDIAEVCRASNDQRLRDLGTQLYPFTSGGTYGEYFKNANNVKFNNRFTVLELDELQGRKHLRQVVLLQLIYQIQQEVFLGDRGRKKIVIVDEAWDLLKEGEVASFMEAAYRKFRKYGGSMGIATQSINDLYENPVGRAIAENSASLYLLGQTEESVESVRASKRLTLSDGGFNLLKTVHTIKGIYSEIFVRSKAGVGVGRLIVGEYQKLLYSTDAADIHAIETHKKRGLDTSDAIRQVLKDRGLYE